MKRNRPPAPLWQRNLYATVAAQILALLAFQASFILIPYYIQELGIRDLNAVAAWTGGYQSIGAVGFAISTPIWGALGDRYGRKPMLVRAMGLTVLVMALMSLTRSPWQLMALRALQGALTGTPAAASALVATGSPRDRLAYALGLVQTAMFVGQSVGPLLGGFTGDAFGYRATFAISAVITLAGVLIVLLLVREPEESAAVAARSRLESPLAGFRALLGLPAVLLLVGVNFALSVTYGLLGPVVPIFIQSLVADPARLASTAGAIVGVGGFSSAVAALVLGRAADRLGHRRVLLSCMAGTGVLYLPLALVTSAFGMGAARFFQGFFQGGISPAVSAMVVQGAGRDKTGVALGLSSSASSAGFAVGPMIGALLVSFLTVRSVFLLAGVVFVLLTVAVTIVVRRQGARRAVEATQPG